MAARVTDRLGLPLSTTAEAAAAYDRGVVAILRVQAGAERALRESVAADPGFALGHAALALLGQESGVEAEVARRLALAEDAVRRRGDARERSHVDAVARRIRLPGAAGGTALLRHVAAHPRDALMVEAAVPTISSAGANQRVEAKWALVDRLAAVYGGDWWYASVLAFVRQEQGRWADATTLADRALAAEPASGHAVHARAHVHYETGEHAAGLAWLTEWVAGTGRDVRHRSHFGWHAALHELALGDDSAVRRRYDTQVAPPHSAGLRALIDAGSLLWRGALADVWRRPLPTAPLLAAAGNAALTRPGSPFTALHAALLLAADGDLSRLAALRKRVPDAQAPMVDGLLAFADERYDDAATLLGTVDLGLGGLGGSAAQREVVEDTLLRALVLAGRLDEARALLARRLDRRPSPRDVSCLAALGPPAAG